MGALNNCFFRPDLSFQAALPLGQQSGLWDSMDARETSDHNTHMILRTSWSLKTMEHSVPRAKQVGCGAFLQRRKLKH